MFFFLRVMDRFFFWRLELLFDLATFTWSADVWSSRKWSWASVRTRPAVPPAASATVARSFLGVQNREIRGIDGFSFWPKK